VSVILHAADVVFGATLAPFDGRVKSLASYLRYGAIPLKLWRRSECGVDFRRSSLVAWSALCSLPLRFNLSLWR